MHCKRFCATSAWEHFRRATPWSGYTKQTDGWVFHACLYVCLRIAAPAFGRVPAKHKALRVFHKR